MEGACYSRVGIGWRVTIHNAGKSAVDHQNFPGRSYSTMSLQSLFGRQFLGSAPYFLVPDVVAAGTFYRDRLGFTLDRYWGEPPCFCMPDRDGCLVMLSQVSPGTKICPNTTLHEDAWDAYFWIRDAEKLFKEFQSQQVSVVHEPRITVYENKEFAIRDLNGYVLAFGRDWSGKK